MARVNFYKAIFEKKILPLMRKKQKEQERMLFYIKLYAHLIAAPEELQRRRGFDRLKIVYDLTRSNQFAGEAHYIAYIHQIAKDVINNRKRIRAILAKDPTADAFHSQTTLLMAQNICLLRILKMTSA